jgi:phage tail-like protein
MLMNADGQKFQLVLGKAEWGAMTVGGLTLAALWEGATLPPDAPGWDDERAELTLAPVLDLIPPTSGEVPLTLPARRAAAADAHGNIYWIGDDATQLFVRSNGDGSVSRFWPDPRARQPVHDVFADHSAVVETPAVYHALTITGDSWLVAASDAGFDSFDLIAGGPPLHFGWPETARKVATDLEARSNGLWLLDGPARRLFEFNSAFEVCGTTSGTPEPDLFQPLSGEPRLSATPIAATGRDLGTLDAIAIAELPGGNIAVLSQNPAMLAVLTPQGFEPPDPIALDFAPHDMICAHVLLHGGERQLRVLVAGGTGNQLRAFHIEGEGTAQHLKQTAESFPLRRYGGRALVSVHGDAHYDSGPLPQWTRIVEKPRQRFAARAVFVSPLLDSRHPQAIWDRLRLDGCIPPGTKVSISAWSSDDKAASPAWIAQPVPLLSPSGSELAAHSRAAIAATDLKARHGTFEFLFQRMQGRYLQLRITLEGDGDASPRLRALRASWPRLSWAEQYLPAIYREGPESADFLDRYLANMQGTVSGIEERMISAQTLFDTRTAPLETLGWLAEWFDVALDPAWKEAQRRAFIKHALCFFGWRGTMRGLESALALAFGQTLGNTLFGDGDCVCEGAIRIVETYRTRTLGRIGAGDSSGIADPPTHDAGLEERNRWVQFQRARGAGVVLETLPRLSVPSDHTDDWAAFVQLASQHRTNWQRLLRGRYRRLKPLNDAHGSDWQTFDAVALFDGDPATDKARADWLVFEQALMTIDRTAHRFSVLLPVLPSDATDAATLDDRRKLASRIIALEKPAHTIFDIRFYFAVNRIGEARLGMDTAIGDGSRAPELLPPAILGKAYLGESFAGPDGLPSSPDRARLAC